MGASMSMEARAAKERSMSIDKQIEEDSRRSKQQSKVLLLGSEKSGKSTIVKQMKIIYQGGYTAKELVSFRLVVYKNLLDSAKHVVSALNKAGFDWDENIHRTYAAQILAYEIVSDISFRLSADIVSAIGSLMQDPVIATFMDRSPDYLMDSGPYFLSQVQRIGKVDYIPSESDVLYAQTKTMGISETRFTMGQQSIQLFDIGIQQSDRRRWFHRFETITSVMFCVALSEYDQVRFRDNKDTGLTESLSLFESIVNSRWFSQASIILLLNKTDIFKAKLSRVPLEQYFPEYTGGPDMKKAGNYISKRFRQGNRANLAMYV